jgi:alkanesulfonate monooxygenase SsuD/methylene tetrahydromethanopterin reductase-like flavin-dependent oxidoreductase (luciferase family)
VKFSLLTEIQIAAPTPLSEQRAFHEAVRQAVLADALGYHAVWAVEHHGLSAYSHCSAPEILLGHIAALTTRIRLGHAVTLTPGRYNHPIRVAERIAVLDILSGGRVNWGSGKSSTLVEQGAFEINRDELDGQWREALTMIPRMWRDELFEWSGTHYHVPPTAVLPKPIQKPHPPIFVACSRPETVVPKIASYRTAIAGSSSAMRVVNNRFCCTPTTIVLDDDRRACEYGFRGARYFQESLATYFFSRERIVPPIDVSLDPLTPGELAKAMADRNGPNSGLTSIIGDPASAIETVRRFEAAGVDELIMVMDLGTVPHEIVVESLRTFADKVMPHFA